MKEVPPKTETGEFNETFRQNELLYERLEKEALFTLKEELNKTEIRIHSIPSRIKKLDSFLDKIRLYKIKRPFEKINDIVGLRVICLFLTDIEKIGKIIRDSFEVIKEDNRVDNSKFASFGYLSVHFIVKLGNNFRGTRYDNLLTIPFEIQVRTIAMDAWANISHYLEYKTDKDIPEELKRDFYALSGMFYVADKHFQLFFEQREEKNEEIAEVFEKGQIEDINSQPINLDTISAFLRGKLPEYTAKSDLSRLVQNLIRAGYKTIGEINSIFEKGKSAANAYLKDSRTETTAPITDYDICNAAFYISDYNYFKIFMGLYFDEEVKILSEEKWAKKVKKYKDLIEK